MHFCKRKILCLLVLVGLSGLAQAGILGDLTGMFMSNSTASGQFSTADRVGISGGSLTMRAPIQNVNLVSFDAPRIDAGCGGVDLYGGSFSFINGAQLEAIFKKVAANAAGLAFKAAIKAISPSLDALLTEFQTLLQKLNNLAKNTCSLAHTLTDPADKAITDALGGTGVAASVQNGQCTDAMGCLSSWMTSATSFLSKSGATNPKAGNQTMKGIIASGSSAMMGTANVANVDGSTDDPTNPNSLNNRILISMLGYRIVSIPCSNLNQNGTPNASQASLPAGSNLVMGTSGNPNGVSGVGTIFCNGPATITLDDLVKGGGAGSMHADTPLNLYYCVNPNGSDANAGVDPQICTSMQTQPFNYVGVEAWVNSNLFGATDPANMTPTSIVGLAVAGGTYTPTTAQIRFLQQANIPLIQIMNLTANPDTKISLAQRFIPKIINCVTASIGESIYKAAILVGKVDGYDLPDDVKTSTNKLRADYKSRQSLCENDLSLLHAAQEMNETSRLMATGTTK